MNLQGRKFDFSIHEYQNLYIGTPSEVFIPITTSIDGKPFMIPSEFEILLLKEKPGGISNIPVKEISELANEDNRQVSQTTVISHSSTTGSSNKRPMDENSNLFPSEEEPLEKKKKLKNDKKSNKENSSLKVKAKNEKSDKKPVVKHSKKTRAAEETKPPKKIHGLQYDKVTKDFMFEIKGYDDAHSIKAHTFSRRDLIQKDPLLLLYFYEECLEFSKDPNFESKNLIKL